jgi:hypothetical protein
MNKIFIIIPIILVLTGIIIIISRKKDKVISCPTDTPILYNNTCVASCPKYLSEDGKECLDSCPKYISEDGKNCTKTIPSGKFVLDGKIVPVCPADYFIDNKICVKQCPIGKYIIRGSDNTGRTCSTICTKYVTPDGKECIDSSFIPPDLFVVEQNKLGSECKKEGNKYISEDGKRCVPSCSSTGKTYYINDYIDSRGSRCSENCIDSSGNYNYKDNRITDNIYKCRKTDYTSGIPFVFNENNNDPSTRELRYSCKSAGDRGKYVDGKFCKTAEECNNKGYTTDKVSTNIFDWSCRNANDPNFTIQNNFLSADRNSIVKSCNKVPFEYEDKINSLERSMGENNKPIIWKCLTQIPETSPKKFFQGYPPGNTITSSQQILDFCQYPYFVNYNSNNNLECLDQVPDGKFADISRNIISSCNETKTGNNNYIVRMFNSETKDCVYPINNFTSIIIDNQGHIYAVTEDQMKYDIIPIWQNNIGKYDITDIKAITISSNIYEEILNCTPFGFLNPCKNIHDYSVSRIEGLNLSDKFFKKILVSNDKKLQIVLVKSSEKLLISLDYGSSWDYLSFNKNYEIYNTRINRGEDFTCDIYSSNYKYLEDIEDEQLRNLLSSVCPLSQELVFDKTLKIHESQIKDICIDQRSDGTYILYYIRESKKYYYIDINGNKVYYSNISEIPDKNFDPKTYFDQYDVNSEIVKLLISPTTIGNSFFGILFDNMAFNSVNGYNIYGKVIKSELQYQDKINIRYVSLDYFYNDYVFDQVEENYCVQNNVYNITKPIKTSINPHLIYAYKDLRTYHTKLKILVSGTDLFDYTQEINNIRIQQVSSINKYQDCKSCGIYNINNSDFTCEIDDYKMDDLTCTPTPDPTASPFEETEAPCDMEPCPTSFYTKYKNYFCCDDDIVEIEADKNGRFITLLIKKINKQTSQGITLCADKFYGYKLDFMRPYEMIDTLTNINTPKLQYALNVNSDHEYKLYFNKNLEDTSLIKYNLDRSSFISVKSKIIEFDTIYTIVYNNPMFTSEQTITTSVGDIVKDVSISPDGKYMAVVINNYILYTDNNGVDWKYWKNPR